MFDRIGDLSIGLVFGIVLTLLSGSLIGLGVGSLLGIGFAVAPNLSKRRSRNDIPQAR
ncbi:hypothetical protein [Exiguobacterium alkaliphilum]|uniref:Glycine zipper family protein n=1 Tax=Exiguobacterium alkaliphilum TaxID=1428684 RepID=A0ABT2L182_9BACL|nr:hypothetical protein [Exiguobacterium alkaliphilum]MCT4796044.1 hypothetical protein [Exiguobacterium alkaliphilum]QUE87123.1 hypothetical protein KB235_04275 [Exiguobacterium alkaliphilum]